MSFDQFSSDVLDYKRTTDFYNLIDSAVESMIPVDAFEAVNVDAESNRVIARYSDDMAGFQSRIDAALREKRWNDARKIIDDASKTVDAIIADLKKIPQGSQMRQILKVAGRVLVISAGIALVVKKGALTKKIAEHIANIFHVGVKGKNVIGKVTGLAAGGVAGNSIRTAIGTVASMFGPRNSKKEFVEMHGDIANANSPEFRRLINGLMMSKYSLKELRDRINLYQKGELTYPEKN